MYGVQGSSASILVATPDLAPQPRSLAGTHGFPKWSFWKIAGMSGNSLGLNFPWPPAMPLRNSIYGNIDGTFLSLSESKLYVRHVRDVIIISTLPYITIKWLTRTGRIWSTRLQLVSKGTCFARICFIPGLPKGGLANALRLRQPCIA